MKKSVIVVMLALLLGAVSSRAVHPEEWGYKSGDYAYAPGPAQWFYFNALDTQWVVDVQTGVWDTFDNMSDWMYFNWPYAYSTETGHWHWFNVNDVQWVCNMGTYQWSIFGYHPAPDGMASIPHGTNTGDDPDFGAYSVSAGTLYADKYEVSGALWNEVAEWGNSHGYNLPTIGSGIDAKGDAYPVYYVRWHDAVAWCNARSEMEDIAPAYYHSSAKTTVMRGDETYWVNVQDDWVDWDAGYRLPTSEEWEYLARGGQSGYRFPWGSDSIDHCCANYNANFDYDYDDSHPAGYHPNYQTGGEPYHCPVTDLAGGMNAYGLYNMAGNVREWCWDKIEYNRVFRGGCYDDNAALCRIGEEGNQSPTMQSYWQGFRTVLPAKP